MSEALVDARGVALDLSGPPARIVSLVPSTTETLHALGLAERVVGVTRFCVRPQPWVQGIDKVGGTKDVQADRVRALRPDLIVGNCEENTQAIFDALAPIAPLWAPLPRSVDAALADLLSMGTICGVPDVARQWHERITEARAAARAAVASPFTYAWMIWRRPYMAVGGDTFTSALLEELGGTNVFAASEARYPEVSIEALRAADPDRVLLSSEPFPFKERHREELASATGWPVHRFHFVDGQLGTWHGVRLAEAFAQPQRITGG